MERKNIALMGTTGTGKSSLGNALLSLDVECGSKHGFLMSARPDGCTMAVDARDGYLLGDTQRPIRVIDTPGASDGSVSNEELRERLVTGMKHEKMIHAFLWIKSFTAPRFDEQDRQFFDIFSEMFGKGFVKNLIVVFTRFSLSDEAEQNRRERQGASLEQTIAGFRQKIGDMNGKVPMLAIDAHYNPENPKEARSFHEACNQLWGHIENFSAQPVEHVEAVKDKMDKLLDQIQRLTDQIEQMRLEHASDKEEWERKLDEAIKKYSQLEKRFQGGQEWPDWFKGIHEFVPVIDNVMKAVFSLFRNL